MTKYIVKSLMTKVFSKEVISYIFFGVCTTFVNIATYWGCAHPLHLSTITSNVIAWITGVLFAYLTNRRWVFHSYSICMKEIIIEMISFFFCRGGTGIVDTIVMYVFIDILGFDDVVIKVICNMIVIILNYLASKLIIFRNCRGMTKNK